MIDCLVMGLVVLVMDCLVIIWGLVGLMIGIVIDLVWSWGGCRLVVLVIGMVIDLVGLGCFL